jgi:hypothetical protein
MAAPNVVFTPHIEPDGSSSWLSDEQERTERVPSAGSFRMPPGDASTTEPLLLRPYPTDWSSNRSTEQDPRIQTPAPGSYTALGGTALMPESFPLGPKRSDRSSQHSTVQELTEMTEITRNRFSGPMMVIENTLKQWRLHWVWILASSRKSRPKSELRVAIHRSFPAAFFASWLHLLPMFAIGAISYFFFADSGYYIGWELAGAPGHDTQKFFALQLAAKLLELLVVFSLSNLIFFVLRNEMLHGHMVPLAAFTSGLQFASPDYIWSKELWYVFVILLQSSITNSRCGKRALVFARFSSKARKALFLILLVVCTALAISIAPSTATVIAPTKQWWEAGGAIVWLNASEAELFPTNLGPGSTIGDECLVTGNTKCPSSNWEQLRDGHIAFVGDSSLFSSGYPLPAVVRGFHSNAAYYPYPRTDTNGFTVAAMGHHAIVDGAVMASVDWNRAAYLATYTDMARKFAWRFDQRFSTDYVPMAWAHTRCANTSITVGSQDARPVFPDFRDMDFKNTYLTEPQEEISAWLNSTMASLSRPETYWFDLDSDMAHNGSVGGVIAVPTSNASIIDLYGCITDARWVDSRYYPDYSSLQASCNSVGSPDGTSALGTYLSDPTWGRRCHISPHFVQYMMPTIRFTNRTVLQDMLMATPFWSEGPGPRQWNSSRYVPYLESVLNILMVNGMASTEPYTMPFQNFNNSDGEWWMDFMPEGTQSGAHGRPSRTPYDVQGNLSNYISFELDADVNGYAYTRQDPSTNLAIICILLYLPLGFGIMCWTLFTRVTSSAWDSISELLMVALKSSPPPIELTQGTSAGIAGLRPLKAEYCIVVSGDTLELKHVQAVVSIEDRVRVNTKYI